MASIKARIITATIAALCFVAAFPPVGRPLAILPALLLLLVSLRGLSARPAFWIAFWHGMVAYGIALSWFWNMFGAAALGLYAILATFVGLFAVAQTAMEKRFASPWPLAILTAINWSGWEFIRAELFPLRYPWMTPGVAIGPNALLPWIGVYGVSFIVVAAIAMLLQKPTRWAGAALCVGISVLSLWQPAPLLVDQSKSVRVAALQYETVSFDVYQKATEQLGPNVQLVLWPEEAAPYDVRVNKPDMKALSQLAQSNRVLILGTQTPIKAGGWFNTALTIGKEGVLGEHYKNHPVHLFDDGTPGTTALPVKTPLGLIGTPICFDCDYEGVVRKMTAAGAEFFAVPSMDGESWSERQHWQHAELFRLRACENGRWMMICPSSGMSQLIDSNGTRLAKLDPMKQGVLISSLERRTALTFYTRWGWLTPWCLLAAALVLWTVLLIPGRR